MTLAFIRTFFLLIIMIVGYFIGSIYHSSLMGVATAAAAGTFLIWFEITMKRASVRGLSSMVFGLLLGVFMSKLVADVISLLPLSEEIVAISRVILTLVFSYLGAVMALRGKDEFHLIIPYVRFKRQDVGERIVLLDTSAIIDGRVPAIYKTRFFDDRLVIPRFVLGELQTLADSDDELKRQRGRRGLDIVDQIQKNEQFDVCVHDDDFFDEVSVDAKLLRLASMLDAKICTTDYNLARVAQIQGIGTLNIHDLVTAVRQRITVGEELWLQLVKEGRESGQAVAYLPDGLMVVVANARNYIGQSVLAQVTSVLKTNAGEMVFADFVRQGNPAV
ncbi:MAG: twitching motility protein PilT [Candidatus Omnitrophota bacterium]